MSHDLAVLLLFVSCWLRPGEQIRLGVVPGLPPMRCWQAPFVLSCIHALVSGSARGVYMEALGGSVLTTAVVHAISAACHELQPTLAGWLGGGRHWSGGWTKAQGGAGLHQA
jgi:hypothetical protein